MTLSHEEYKSFISIILDIKFFALVNPYLIKSSSSKDIPRSSSSKNVFSQVSYERLKDKGKRRDTCVEALVLCY
jgi:hypothetical protein